MKTPRTRALSTVATLALGYTAVRLLMKQLAFRNTEDQEASDPLPGDDLVSNPKVQYTIAANIDAPPDAVWPWLLQIGRDRGGFYTFNWIENLLGADIHNVDQLMPLFQHLRIGDKIWLTPDPYVRNFRGQYLTVSLIDPERTLVLSQTLANGSVGTWTYALRPQNNGTRFLFRRRSQTPTWMDRAIEPGYLIMDLGMIRGLKKRAETAFQAPPDHRMPLSISPVF